MLIKKTSVLLMAVLALLFIAPVAAKTISAKNIPAAIKKTLDGAEITALKPTVIADLYQATVNGSNLIYITKDGRYVLHGDIIDTKLGVNMTQQSIVDLMQKMDYLAYTPKGGAKYYINVFTDIDCPYCQKLHREMDQYQKHGVEVRYFFFPRSGPYSASAQKLENVWCSKNPQKAMTEAKNQKTLPKKNCKNPIEQHMQLARQLGLQGTPLIYTEHGERIGGYRPANAVLQALKASELKQKQAKK